MKEIKKEIIKEQIIYEITKEELDKIKIEERNKGRFDILEYLVFSIKYYQYEFTIKGTMNFCENLIDFLSGKTTIIENTYGYSLHDYINNIKKDCKYI